MSLDAPAQALQSAAATESNFQSLYEAGAFNADGKPDPAPTAAPDTATPAPPAAQAPAPADPAAPADAPAADEPEYQSLEDYLTKANVDPASFHELPVTVKIDGKTSQVRLADVIKSYQLEGHVQQKSQAVAEQQRQLEAERQQAQQFVAQQLTAAQALGNLAQAELLGQYRNINWAQLRQDNPAEWAAAQQEFNQRAAAIQQHLAQINEAQRIQTLQQQEQLVKALPVEQEKLYAVRPEWRDPAKFQEARTLMGSTAKAVGFTDAELSQVFDHRYLVILDKAARYDALQAGQAQAVKRVRTAPIAAQPGARMQRDPSQVALSQAKEAVRKNPRDQDAQARLFGRLA